ncbi:hypothetical protein [Sulfurovum sp. AR]|nr:hypothetical protein [Sulfurovum sp. AR]
MTKSSAALCFPSMVLSPTGSVKMTWLCNPTEVASATSASASDWFAVVI